jgi:hypothetical protein
MSSALLSWVSGLMSRACVRSCCPFVMFLLMWFSEGSVLALNSFSRRLLLRIMLLWCLLMELGD